jgi:hypothetical protein
VRKRVAQYEAAVEILCSIMATGCYWGTEEHHELWTRVLERVGSKESIGGLVNYIAMRRYPAALLLYCGGIAAIAHGNYKALKALLLDTKVRNGDQVEPAADVLDARSALDHRTAQVVFQKRDRYTPVSEHLYERLREPLRPYLPDDNAYEAAFDRFEYLLAFVSVDQALNRGAGEDLMGIPWGRFGWRRRLSDGESSVAKAVREERYAQDALWGPIQAGLILSTDRFDRANKVLTAHLAKLRWF